MINYGNVSRRDYINTDCKAMTHTKCCRSI